MNVEKMRRQLERQRPCGARYLHAPGHDVEVCTLVGDHERHNWPSLPTDPSAAFQASMASGIRLAGMALQRRP